MTFLSVSIIRVPLFAAISAIFVALLPIPASAADYPAPKQGEWVARDFRFHTGEVLPELKLHYTTVGNPSGLPVVVLHGTGGTGAGLLTPAFAGELFGPGQPLDASKYFIILPDALGHGQSAKPSDGLRTKFPQYDYSDMVDAQYRLVKEGLGINHVRLVIGFSMGGMNTWLWGEKYPTYMDALVPMAAEPGQMSGRNWMLRRMLLETVRNDPSYDNGHYTSQPRLLKIASTFFNLATGGGTLRDQKIAPTADKADDHINTLLAAPFTTDANDFVYQWNSSRDYNPSPGLEKIQAALLAINSADDERNPPETGIMEHGLKHVKNGHFYLIPASAATSGHFTTTNAAFYKRQLADFLQSVPARSAVVGASTGR